MMCMLKGRAECAKRARKTLHIGERGVFIIIIVIVVVVVVVSRANG